MGFPVINGNKVWTLPPKGYDVDFADPQKDTTITNWIYFLCVVAFLISFSVFGHLSYTAFRDGRKWAFKNCKIG
jgi:hypothetical protein